MLEECGVDVKEVAIVVQVVDEAARPEEEFILTAWHVDGETVVTLLGTVRLGWAHRGAVGV